MSSLSPTGSSSSFVGPAGPAAAGAGVDRQGELFAAARAGDRAAFGRLVALLQDRLYNAVSRLCRNPDDALEVTQEAFTKALDKIGDCRGDSQPYTWLFRIAMNVAVSRHRAAVVRKAASLDGEQRPSPRSGGQGDQMTALRDRLAAKEPGPPQVIERRERLQQVAAALAALDDDDRALLVMRDVDGMEYAEMARVLEVPLGTLKSKLFRARMALRNRVEGMDRR